MKHLYLINLGNTELEEFSKGDTLLKEGEICKYIYFIERGQLRTFYAKNGKNINVNFFFGNHLMTNLKSFLYSERYHYVAKYYPMLLQWVSLSQLSSYVGISRETISRIRRNTFTFSGIWFHRSYLITSSDNPPKR